MRYFFFYLLFSCQTAETTSFRDAQFNPTSPCWSVNLSDGLDEDSSEEFGALYDCINQNNAFAPLNTLIEHWSQPALEGPSLIMQLAIAINALQELEWSLSQLIADSYTFIHEHGLLFSKLESLVVELIYGMSRTDPPENTAAQSALDQGLLKPSLETLQDVAQFALDTPELIEDSQTWSLSPYAKDAACTVLTFDAFIDESAAERRAALQSFLEAPLNSQNNRWSESSDDSLKDWLHASLANDHALIMELRQPAYEMLSDPRIQAELKSLLEAQILSDNIHQVPSGLHYLLSVDVNGGILNDDEPSAFFHLMRLLHHSNQSLNCSFNLFGVPITQIQIDNLAVQLLTRLSEADESNLSSAIDLLYLLDLGVAEFAMDSIIDSNVCPLLTDDFITDTRALERLNDAPARPLLSIGLDAVKRLKHEDTEKNRLYELADILSITHASGLTEPTEELLRDILLEDMVTHGLNLLPQWLDIPDASSLCPESSKPIDIDQIFDGIEMLLAPDAVELNHILRISDVLLESPSIWEIRLKLIDTLDSSDFVLMAPIDLLESYLAWDTQLDSLNTFGQLYQIEAIRTVGLNMLSDEETRVILTQSTEENPGPLSLIGDWIYSDTLQDLLEFLDALLTRLLETRD